MSGAITAKLNAYEVCVNVILGNAVFRLSKFEPQFFVPAILGIVGYQARLGSFGFSLGPVDLTIMGDSHWS